MIDKKGQLQREVSVAPRKREESVCTAGNGGASAEGDIFEGRGKGVENLSGWHSTFSCQALCISGPQTFRPISRRRSVSCRIRAVHKVILEAYAILVRRTVPMRCRSGGSAR